MKTRQKHVTESKIKRNKNIFEKGSKSMLQSSSQNKESNISTGETSRQMENNLSVKNTINDEDLNLMVKNFIRLALALEHNRTPIKKEDISKKVLLPSHSRSFAIVFEKTQEKLRNVFGMELVELPYKNNCKHISTSHLRKNQNFQTHNPFSIAHLNKSWILCSILDPKYSDLIFEVPTIKEGIFSGIVMTILSILIMNGGEISNELLIRYLSQLQMDNDTSIGNLDKTLKEMVKKGYLERIKDDITSANEGEKNYTYLLGPRGKTEIDPESLTTFIKKIQGDAAPQNLKEIVKKLFNKSISSEP
ncbi:hypothetical protein PNEG_01218 [Pneumocystis murina B123]|uniref:MAGE domain-containing protein n=1 Tax=Pneumocystis murina (strain B123) TaxID=1069680 RepID=M7NTR8_PNEMU|nr:hypothetical protein PNEG_01218 [Pneumocystis murina B123]EMR10506.1 hypothetical protein PNEG_01218 [Pneumocystis murina B123]